MLNELINNFTSFDHELNAARLCQIGDHLLNRVAANDGFAFGAAFKKLVHLKNAMSSKY